MPDPANALSVSVILPTLNEAGNIISLMDEIRRVVPALREILVVDDNSSDGTGRLVADYAEKSPAGLVRLESRMQDPGLTRSLWHGVERAAGDIIVWMDCDFSMPPAMIPRLLDCIEMGYPIAVGSRFVHGGSFKQNTEGTPDSWVAVFLSRAMNYGIQWLLDGRFKDYTSGFAAVRRSVFQDIRFRGDYGEYFIDFIFRALRQGYQIIEVPYACVPRRAGESKTGENLWDYLRRGTGYILTAARLRFATLRSPQHSEQEPEKSLPLAHSSTVTIQGLTPEHIPLTAALHYRVLRDTMNSRLGMPFLQMLYAGLVEDSSAKVWVAMQGRRPVGFISATWDLFETRKSLVRQIPLKRYLSEGVHFIRNFRNLGDFVSQKRFFRYLRRTFGHPYPTILTFGVSPEAQGKGIGHLLMKECEAFFISQHAVSYTTDTLIENVQAQKFYEKWGFVRVGRHGKNLIYRRSVTH